MTDLLGCDRWEPRLPLPAPPAPIALVHGFTQNRNCWGPIPEMLAQDRPVAVVDAPGHGTSSDVRADLHESGRLVGATVGRSSLVGYSMGGRMALHLALDEPDLVERLVLIGATAGLDDDTERAARRQADEALADHIEAIGVDAFIDEWLAQPLFAGLSPESACRDERLTNSVDGLASSLRLAGTGTQEPLWGRLHELAMPVLVVAGSEDAKFRAIGQRMTAAIGDNAELVVIEGAGHSAHLERPDTFVELLLGWLSSPVA